MKKTTPLLFILITTLLAACASQAFPSLTEIPAQGQTPLPPPAVDPVSAAESTPVLPSAAWKEVRDPRFGFGLAVPCWWIVSPIPSEGMGGFLGLTNYDEAYSMANSQKGFWDWPNGALKIDVVVFENIDPSLPDADAYKTLIDPSTEEIISSTTQQTGSHIATVLTLQNLVNQSDPAIRVFIYRLDPEKLILINPVPQSIIDTPDFQAVLASIVLAPTEQVVLPSASPASAPLIDASCAY